MQDFITQDGKNVSRIHNNNVIYTCITTYRILLLQYCVCWRMEKVVENITPNIYLKACVQFIKSWVCIPWQIKQNPNFFIHLDSNLIFVVNKHAQLSEVSYNNTREMDSSNIQILKLGDDVIWKQLVWHIVDCIWCICNMECIMTNLNKNSKIDQMLTNFL